ncbi:cytochrome P450 family protein [Streptomyces reniochalinae]|uniref:Cytochrome P450 n=1 Tax=Streptomyces reniochalinae TaxID=2250578 RepID=A0A367EG26_9ACTN|nr:cytochrome P450 [Streptomyces reniochalinae]RCG16170.1 cytochrome P450 [Streptomyces reniochalinae]
MSTNNPVNLRDRRLLTDPHTAYSELREAGPLVRATALDGSQVWLVTRQEDVQPLLADRRLFTDPEAAGSSTVNVRSRMLEKMGVPAEVLPHLTETLLDLDGADHTRIRKLVSRTFTARRVGALLPRVEEITSNLLDRLTGADLVQELGYPLPITVICELVGVPEADRADWRRWSDAFMRMDRQMPAALREMVEYCHDLTASRRAYPRQDLLSGMVAEVDEHGEALTDGEIVTMLIFLVFAGHETTAHLITNGAHALMTHPEQLTLLRDDPSLWPSAVNELMRFCSPVLSARVRYLAEDVEIGGVMVPAGEAVMPVVVSANYDPRVYQDPERLDVTRKAAGHLGFGAGPHYCLGAALARQEGEVALRGLFERYPGIRFCGPEPQWSDRPGMYRLLSLPVTLG